MYCDVVICNNSLFIENTYTYKVPNDITADDIIGKRVTVPFGNDTKLGLIVSVHEKTLTEFIEFKELLTLIDDYPIVTNDVIAVLLSLSERTGNTISRYLNSIYPITFNIQKKTVYKVNNIDEIDLVLRTILPEDEFEISGELIQYEKDINKYTERGAIVSKVTYFRKLDYKYSDYVRYTGVKQLRTNKNQEQIIEFFKNSDNELFKIKTLVNQYGFSKNTINTLIRKNILEKKYLRGNPIKSSNDRAKISDIQLVRKKKFIHSNIASVKIEYLKKLIDENLSSNKNTLVMLPDIASATVMLNEIENSFKEKIEIYHSKVSDRKKFDLLTKINNDEVQILIGVGGAALAPLKNIGAIVLFDSNDERYLKSQFNFYDLVSLTESRSKMTNCDLIHISTSHTVTEYYKMKNDLSWECINLGYNSVFKKSVVDMKEELKKGNHKILSLDLIDKLKKQLSNFETSFLLVNARSDNSSLKCRGCGKTTTCPHCGTNLRLSNKTGRLSCSSCSFEIQFQNKCIYCGSDKIRKMKLGIENVYEFVKDEFKESSVLILTTDDLTSTSKMDKIIANINLNKYDIIIGTRSIASLLPKNKISLIAIIMIDITLNINSYKASELAFNEIMTATNIISHNSSNELLIQTYEPNNKIINYAINVKYDKFYNDEIIYREISKNPPYREVGYLCIRTSESNYTSITNNLNLYITKHFETNTYFGPIIDRKSGSSMIKVSYTIKVKEIDELIKFRKILVEAFKNESLFITIEHE